MSGERRGAPPPRWGRADLGYCSNVHPGEDLGQLHRVMRDQMAAVRAARGLPEMACGLWIGAPAAAALAEPEALEAFADTLRQAGLRLLTLNGFPHGDFHAEQVKAAVYQPDWSDPRRLRYTLDLAQLLARCLPADQEAGTLSTLPLGSAVDWNEARHGAALVALCRLAAGLARLYQSTGRRIRVCLEMEPGCVLETSDQLIGLFLHQLPGMALRLGLPPDLPRAYLGCCFDVCHQAVMFEPPGEALARILDAGIAVGKIQVSSALELERPDLIDPGQALGAYAEPRYLHQVRSRAADGTLRGCADLPEALGGALPRRHPWRVHFHVPIQARDTAHPALATTQDAILAVLDQLTVWSGPRPHLEVETYTWQVLPPDLRPADPAALHRGLAAELAWLEQAMAARGLLA